MDQKVFSQLVSAIYDSAIDVALWPETLGRICKTFGFRKGTVDLNRLPSMTNVFNYHFGIDERQAATMVSHYGAMPDVWGGLTATMTRPINRPWVVSRILTQEALARTTYYRDWVGPMGLIDGAAIVLARDHSLFGSMRLATDVKRGLIDDGMIDALTLLLPHCQRAARIGGMLDQSQKMLVTFEAVVNALTLPVLLISKTSSIVHANGSARALLEDGSLLRSQNGTLCSTLPGLQKAIANTVRRLADTETDIPGSGLGLAVRAPSGVACALHILPLVHGTKRSALTADAVAAIFVSSASIEQSLRTDVLMDMFGLTQAEARVFERIFAGESTAEIARQLVIEQSTVRTHVLHIFQKTETNSRAGLVQLGCTYASQVLSKAKIH